MRMVSSTREVFHFASGALQIGHSAYSASYEIFEGSSLRSRFPMATRLVFSRMSYQRALQSSNFWCTLCAGRTDGMSVSFRRRLNRREFSQLSNN
jgi:hypothetical protein